MQEHRFSGTRLSKDETMDMINRIHQKFNLIATRLFADRYFNDAVSIFVRLLKHLIIVSLNHSCLRFPLCLLVDIAEQLFGNAWILQVRYMFSLLHTLQIQY